MEKDIMIIEGVRGYEKDDVVYVHLYDVAMGLGITQKRKNITYIRWERVIAYLEELGFPTHGERELIFGTHGENLQDAYIPENIFYRLAMKTKNEVAERFQAKLADEVIPSIRKHGMYISDKLTKEKAEEEMSKIFSEREKELSDEITKLKKEKKKLQTKIKKDRGKVAEHDRFFYHNRADGYRFREVAKGLGVKEKDLLKALHDDKRIYKTSRMPWLPCVNQGKYFRVIKTSSKNGKWQGHQTLVKPAGIKLCEKIMGLTFDYSKVDKC